MAPTVTSSNGTKLDGIDPELRKTKFAGMLAAKVEQGYEIESQGETEAVVVTRGRRRRFHAAIDGKRQRISIDEQGRPRSHGLDEGGR
jgi:hypothetical protein